MPSRAAVRAVVVCAALVVAGAAPPFVAPAAAGDPPKAATKKKDDPPPPLRGTTVDYDYDGGGRATEAWQGRAYVHPDVTGPGTVPLLVFIHGLNVEKIKYRWIGGGNEGDVRRILSELIDAGLVAPMVLAAPTSTDPATMVNALTTWPGFDLEKFIDRTQAALGSTVRLDRRRVVVAGHSGAGCNAKGGIATALTATRGTPALAGLVIDSCMGTDLALELNKAKSTNVVVTWQEISWANRPTTDFRRVFERAVKADPPPAGILRELDRMQPKAPSPHDAMVAATFKKWLPRFLPGRAAPTP